MSPEKQSFKKNCSIIIATAVFSDQRREADIAGSNGKIKPVDQKLDASLCSKTLRKSCGRWKKQQSRKARQVAGYSAFVSGFLSETFAPQRQGYFSFDME